MAVRFDCGYCSIRSIGRVSCLHVRQVDSLNFVPYFLVVCDSCSCATYLSCQINSAWLHQLESVKSDNSTISIDELHEVVQYPKKQVRIADGLPDRLVEVMDDAEFNFSAGRWKAATQLYLQALEFAIIYLEADGSEAEAQARSEKKIDLTTRINGLFKDGKIADSLKEWAHQIRVVGQYHKHRMVDADKNDCEDVRDYLDLFLRYTFSLPSMISRRRQRMKSGAQDSI